MDTKREHRTHAEGSPRGKPCDLTYSPSGRLIGKFRDNNSVTLSASVDMAYGYCDDYQPHAVKRMFNYNNGMLYDMRWDEAGNLGQVSMAKPGGMFQAGRFLYWTEDNRMHAAVDDKHYSYYAYDYGGERRLKLTGKNDLLDVNADIMATYTLLNEPTLYPSAYMVLTNKGYTKHYYAGTERVAARMGGGGLDAMGYAVGNDEGLRTKADKLFKQSLEQVNSRVLQENDLDCIMNSEFAKEEFAHPIDGIPLQMKAKVELDHRRFKDMVNTMLADLDNGQEDDVYFYHSDHLGSASWITDYSGTAVQHLQYLPFGEPFVNEHATGAGYSERFTFTGKERDEETGYGYFGARYMDHELTTMFISIDRYASKYPSISPYAYCAWNPIKLIDPTGDTLNIPAFTDANHGATKECLISLLKKTKYSGCVSVGCDGSVSVSATEKQQKGDIGLSLIYDLVNSKKKFYFEVSDDISSVFNDGRTHDMEEVRNGVINASNGGLDSKYTYTHTPKEGYDGHVIIARSGQWKQENPISHKVSDIRASITFHELAENFYRTNQGMDYHGDPAKASVGAHSMAIDREGITYRYFNIGIIPKASSSTPNSGYYYKKKHVL